MRFLFVLFFILFVYRQVSGQVDSVNSINEINITDYRFQNIEQTGRVKNIKLKPAELINVASLSDLLKNESAVFMKDNGGGRLATISIRGTSASQNTLTWNGLSLNNLTLGLSDFSLMPAFFIDRAAIQYGGNGSLNGSAAIGGAVHLSSSPTFNEGWTGKIFNNVASFNDFQEGASISYSGKNYYMKTAVFNHYAKNNYRFKDIYILGSPVRQQAHAAIEQNGILSEQYLILKNSFLSVHCMYLDAGREIPPPMGSTRYQSDQFEKDKQLRLVTEWNHAAGRLQTMVRLGLVDDRLDYTDGLIKLQSKSRGQNIQSEAEAKYTAGQSQVTGGFRSNLSQAYVNSLVGDKVEGYPGYHHLNRSSVYLSYKYTLKKSLLTTVSLRKELEKEKDYPVLPAFGLRLHLYDNLFLYSNIAAVYRTPTLNDFYWQPGGNALLKPEQGFQSDIRLQNQFSIKNISIDLEAGSFYMKINNWIQWVPNNNIYSPMNIETVVSTGTELSGSIGFHLRKWEFNSGSEMEYIIAENKNGFNSSAAASKQLIYTPKIKWLLTQSVSLHHTSFRFAYEYTGYRYTTADNLRWLTPYGVANCSLSQELKSNYGYIYITAGMNNIFDTNYEVIALSPMPGRWFRLSIMLILNSKKSTQ